MMTNPVIITYGLLTLSLIALWVPIKANLFRTIHLWQVLCVGAIGCGLLFGFVHIIGVLPIIGLAIACYIVVQEQLSPIIRIVAGIGVFILSVGLSVHIMPGFSNPKVIVDVVFSKGGIPFSKHLNFDKTVVGLFLLGFTFKNLLSTPRAWLTMLKKMTPIAGLTIVVILILSLVMGYVRFDVKWTPLFGIWVWSNLFFTCIAEEGVFRGFIQKHLVGILAKYRYGAGIGMLIASSLFGLAHYPGGVRYMFLATVAGLGYGWAYHHTKSIEASILTHFLLNTLHFLFFTYPALASAF
jgi:membrane protease YdiL (CAAX protease family)